jgi:hypothetical protein
MITIWIDDYLVVLAYVNQFCLDTFALLQLDANLLMLINLTWLINTLIILNLDASRLISSLVLFKAFACLVVIFWSPWISLAECSRSSFALVVFYVQVRNCFLLPAMPMRDVSGKFKLMRVGLCIGTLRVKAPMDGILF